MSPQRVNLFVDLRALEIDLPTYLCTSFFCADFWSFLLRTTAHSAKCVLAIIILFVRPSVHYDLVPIQTQVRWRPRVFAIW